MVAFLVGVNRPDRLWNPPNLQEVLGAVFTRIKRAGCGALTSYSAKLRTSGANFVLALIYGVHKNNFPLKYFYCSTTLVGQDLFIAEVSGLHCDILHSVGTLWAGDRPVTEAST